MGIRWRFQVDTLEVSGSFGSGPLSVIPFCHRISITHGATSTAPSTREVAYERQKIDNAATVSRGTLRPVIYLGRKYEASVTSYTPPVGCRSASCNKQHLYRVVTLTGLRALRDLRAPRWPGMILGFLRHPPTRPCRKQAIYIAGQSEPPGFSAALPNRYVFFRFSTTFSSLVSSSRHDLLAVMLASLL